MSSPKEQQMNQIQIAGTKVGLGFRPFIIAEMSGNHNQSLERALAIVEAAARTGVQALKLQTYTADTLTLDVQDPSFVIDDGGLWHGYSLYKLYQVAHTPWEWHEPIMKRAKELGLICFSTPFDETAVDFLEKLNVPAYKIASFEATHLPLIKKAASTGKPLIISIGMAKLKEVEELIATAQSAGCKELILLKCTTAYPAKPEDAHLRTIPDMRKRLGCEVGLSDHTLGIGVSLAAVAVGATVIEKHFTLRRADGGVDAEFSMEPEEMKALVIESERVWQAMGEVFYGPTEAEKPSLLEQQSLYVAKDMKAGDAFTKENIRCIRPHFGLAPKYYDVVLGRKATRDLKMGTPLSWELVSGAPPQK